MHDSELNIPQPVTAPAWIQLGVMVNDGSGSMTLQSAEPDTSLEGVAPARTKAAAVDNALKDFIKRMKSSRKAGNFCLSFVSFNDRVTDQRNPEALPSVSSERSYDPTAHGTGGTAIHKGLDAAAEIVDDFMREAETTEIPVSVVVVLLSDGEERDDPVKTAEAAARLRELPNTMLAACLFATKDQPAHGEQLLEEIVSEPRLYQRVHNAEQLRKFFVASVSASHPALPAPGE